MEPWRLPRLHGGFKNPGVIFVSGGKFQNGWQGTLDHYVRDYGGSPERRGKLHFYNMKVELLAPDAAMLVGQYRLERGARVTEGVNTRLFRKIHARWLITVNHVSAYDLASTPNASKRDEIGLPELRPRVGAVPPRLGRLRDQPEARVRHTLTRLPRHGRLRGLMKSSAELIHISGALIRSSFGHGL